VVGNPANTNALIAMKNAPSLDPKRFTAMTRLDHNRALAQLAQKLDVHTTDLTRLTIWGNHSSTQYPDVSHALVGGQAVSERVDQQWLEDTFIPTVQQRGAAIIKAAARRRRPRRPRPQSTICATGRSARPSRRLAVDGRSRPTAATASRKA
jgi:malate/lactate dehydrogenase